VSIADDARLNLTFSLPISHRSNRFPQKDQFEMKKTISAICSLLFIAVLIAGCAAPQAAAPTKAPEPTQPQVAAAPEKKAVTISYMVSQGWIKDPELELAKKFEAETGIHVDYQIIPADQYFNVLKTKLNAGEATDIFGGQSGKTDLKIQYDVENNALDLTNEEWVSRMDPNAKDQVSLNGKVYGAEIWDIIASNYFIMVYNKKIFADNGIAVPKTYAEFVAACEKIKAAGIVPIYEPVADGWHHVLWFPMVGPRYEELNPGLAQQLNENKTTFAANDTLKTAMTQLNELYQKGYFGDNALSDTYADANKQLASGKYAMAVTTLTAPISIEKDYPPAKATDFGFFPIPLVDNQLAPAHPAGPSKFIYKKSQHVEEARQYLEYLMKPENLQYLLDNTPDFASLDFSGLKPKWTPEQQVFMDTYKAKTIVYQDAVNYVNPQWMDMGKDIVSMFTGAMTPEDVLKSIDQRRADMAKTASDPAWAK
jgi:raffinose/stachyose/melibiose transport system substrate-binding protein